MKADFYKFFFLTLSALVAADNAVAIECDETRIESISTSQKIFERDAGLYPKFEITERISASDLVTKIEDFSDSLWSMKVSCTTKNAVFFDMYLMNEFAKGFSGYFNLVDGIYHSGPHSESNSNEIVVQMEVNDNN